jgi:iron-sulfur cluster repair protein YtfE (RIC family)
MMRIISRDGGPLYRDEQEDVMADGSLARAERTVAELARNPRVLELLKSRGINHCCGAHLPLRQAAAAAGVSLDEILAAIEAAESVPA